MSDDTPTEPQSVAGDYILGSELGSGGFGCVYKARHRVTGFKYAVKRVQLTNADAERFRNEAIYPAEVASESNHVLRVHGFFRDTQQGFFYIVTELIPNGDLA